MKILILGADGALGQALCNKIEDTSFRQVLPVTKEICDITNDKQVNSMLNKHKPNVIINCAAYTNVKGAEDNSIEAWNVNAEAVAHLAIHCQTHNTWLIHISTDYVFKGNKQIYSNHDEVYPLQIYGSTKLAGELAVQSIMHPITWTIIRTSTLYGPPHRPSFVRTIIRNAILNDKIEVVINQVSCPTSVDLLAQLIWTEILLKQRKGIVHLCGKGSCSKFEFACEIVDLLLNMRTSDNIVSKVVPKIADKNEQPQRPLCSVLRASGHWENWKTDLKKNLYRYYRDEWKEYIEKCKSERP